MPPKNEGPRRFDTRFFLVAAPEDQEGTHDDAELVHSMYLNIVSLPIFSPAWAHQVLTELVNAVVMIGYA